MDDKQKTMAVGALFVLVIGIGAFQFMGGALSGPREKAKGTKVASADGKTGSTKQGKKGDKGTTVRNPLFAAALPARDPFEAGHITNAALPEATDASNKGNRLRIPGNRNISVPPYEPLGGRLPSGLPDVRSPGSLTKPDEFTMSLSAVIMGDRPAAVFQDEEGNQRTVTLGGAVDGESRITRIERGRVTVARKGKTVTLTVGAKTNGNNNL